MSHALSVYVFKAAARQMVDGVIRASPVLVSWSWHEH